MERSKLVRMLGTGRLGQYQRIEEGGMPGRRITNVLVKWDDDPEGEPTWHRTVDWRTDVVLVLALDEI
ncbi:hypothetical protein SSEA_SKINNY_158 [Mycobacterium phage Skinny]|uniref:Uncharacterized protein n=6 Tax=Bongovirus bongo TaxID=1983750 RepID=A0A0M4RAC8_9CAUD|nr:hypothetical protein PEGLEG_154 [Mycobacterium phage PegLeg]YP_009604985.1 hypothetical protein FDH95_gp096 [Mycobacterium phage Bongo]ALF00662.1 hypothetical protein SEA_BRICOLE_156 [Mycobacterium phage Bricole]AXQ52773.1 hypothetical protein SEA_IPHANE7_151 [Mycobacterium phage IPhane7]QDH93706.1 hypothetical protein SEA_LILHOMIEP_150 [Mycobacterium phage LilhomieP]QGJ93275.1 hypothetical protein SEA_TYDAWG_147 [Mycobacterium phage TyDawg]QUU29334.1 hypothetical protein [Mycobacterium ph